MVESQIATYLQANTSLSKGSDLFLSELPLEQREGVAIRAIRPEENFAQFNQDRILVLVFKQAYPDARELAATIASLLNDKRGSLETGEGNWSVQEAVRTFNYGKDDLDRYTFAILADVIY